MVIVACLTGCGADGTTLRDTVFDPPATTTSTSSTTVPVVDGPAGSVAVPSTSAAVPASTPDAERTVVIDRLFSPANATAEVWGTGARLGDAVTVDEATADVVSFDIDGDDFVVQVWIPDEGAHTVCVHDVCGRVYTLAPDADTPEEVDAKIDAAVELAADYLDVATLFPDWTIETRGALSGTGGTTDVETKTVAIYRNRGRTVDDFVRTVLHEFGHVADDEWLTDDARATYRELRGIDPASVWREESGHRLDDWAQQPSEDFAEVMVMLWTDGRWTPRTLDPAPPPTAEQLAAIADLVGQG